MDWLDRLLEDNDPAKIDYATSLVHTSIYEPHKQDKILRNLSTLTVEELDTLIGMLLDDQRCNIDSGANYSKTDIVNKLKKL